MKTQAITHFIYRFDDCYHACNLSFKVIINAAKEYTIDDCSPDDLHIYEDKNLFVIEKENYTEPTVYLDVDTITSMSYVAIEK